MTFVDIKLCNIAVVHILKGSYVYLNIKSCLGVCSKYSTQLYDVKEIILE